jgi:hypothetical protein
MFNFEAFLIIKWVHLMFLSLAGGGAVCALVLSGLQEGMDGHSLSAALWKYVVAWGFRLAVLTGIVLLILKMHAGLHPFDDRYLHVKLLLVLILLFASEKAPRFLATGRHSAALLAVVGFLLATFVSVNAPAFGTRVRAAAPESPVAVYSLR